MKLFCFNGARMFLCYYDTAPNVRVPTSANTT